MLCLATKAHPLLARFSWHVSECNILWLNGLYICYILWLWNELLGVGFWFPLILFFQGGYSFLYLHEKCKKYIFKYTILKEIYLKFMKTFPFLTKCKQKKYQPLITFRPYDRVGLIIEWTITKSQKL